MFLFRGLSCHHRHGPVTVLHPAELFDVLPCGHPLSARKDGDTAPVKAKTNAIIATTTLLFFSRTSSPFAISFSTGPAAITQSAAGPLHLYAFFSYIALSTSRFLSHGIVNSKMEALAGCALGPKRGPSALPTNFLTIAQPKPVPRDFSSSGPLFRDRSAQKNARQNRPRQLPEPVL